MSDWNLFASSRRATKKLFDFLKQIFIMITILITKNHQEKSSCTQSIPKIIDNYLVFLDEKWIIWIHYEHIDAFRN